MGLLAEQLMQEISQPGSVSNRYISLHRGYYGSVLPLAFVMAVPNAVGSLHAGSACSAWTSESELGS